MIETEKKKTEPEKLETAELAAQLAPLEEQQADSRKAEQNGVIFVGSKENKRIPAGLSGQETEGAFQIDKVIIFILLIALAYIAFIAYMVSQMPEQK